MRFKRWGQRNVGIQKLGKLFAAVIVGLSIGTLLPPNPVTLPVVGSVSGLLAGGVGLVVGTGLFLRARRSSSNCNCSGNCGC